MSYLTCYEKLISYDEELEELVKKANVLFLRRNHIIQEKQRLEYLLELSPNDSNIQIRLTELYYHAQDLFHYITQNAKHQSEIIQLCLPKLEKLTLN